MFEDKGIVPSPEAEEHLTRYFEFLYEYRDKYFGNARTVRQVVTEAIKNQNLRLAALTPEEKGKCILQCSFDGRCGRI